jgi:F1F0 ATPase subunit 2
MSQALIHEYLSIVAEASGWFVVGTLLGLLHFVSLRWNVRCLLSGQALFLLGLQFIRFVLTGGALALVAKFLGVMPLIVVTLGLIAARNGMLLLEPHG